MAFKFVYEYPKFEFSELASLPPDDLQTKLSSLNETVADTPAAVAASTASTSTAEDVSLEDIESAVSGLAAAASSVMESAFDVLKDPKKRFYHDVAYVLKQGVEKLRKDINKIFIPNELVALNDLLRELLNNIGEYLSDEDKDQILHINSFFELLSNDLLQHAGIITEMPLAIAEGTQPSFIIRLKRFIDLFKDKASDLKEILDDIEDSELESDAEISTGIKLVDMLLNVYKRILQLQMLPPKDTKDEDKPTIGGAQAWFSQKSAQPKQEFRVGLGESFVSEQHRRMRFSQERALSIQNNAGAVSNSSSATKSGPLAAAGGAEVRETRSSSLIFERVSFRKDSGSAPASASSSTEITSQPSSFGKR